MKNLFTLILAFTGCIAVYAQCNAPSGLYIENIARGTVAVYWETSNYDQTYTIEYGEHEFEEGKGDEVEGDINRNYMQVVIDGLYDNTLYDFRLTETCSEGESFPVEGYSTTVEECSLPTELSYDINSTTSAELYWKSFNVGQPYMIEYSTDPNFPEGTGEQLSGIVTDMDMTVNLTLEPGSFYIIKVREVCESGDTTQWNGQELVMPGECDEATYYNLDYVSSKTAVLRFESYSLGNNFKIEFGPEGFTPNTVDPDARTYDGVVQERLNEVILTNLVSDVDYDAYLMIECPSGNFTNQEKISFTTMAAESLPENDECEYAETLELGTNSGTTFGATGTDRPLCNQIINSSSLGTWFTFTPANTYNYKFDMCLPENDFDSQIEVFTGSCASLECVKAEDDDPSCDDNHPNLTTSLNAGETYTIYISGYDYTDFGDFTLELSYDSNYVGCDEPEDIEVIDIDETSATLSYTSSNLDAYFAFSVGVLGYDVNNDDEVTYGEGTVIQSDVTFPIEGLEANTTYDLYMIEECREEILGVYGPFTFSTNIVGLPDSDQTTVSANGYVFSTSEIITEKDITVYDLSGNTIQFALIDNRIHLNANATGMYLVTITTDSGSKTFKIIH